jgi:LysM repeat protein
MKTQKTIFIKRIVNFAIVSAFLLAAAFTVAPVTPALAVDCAVNHVVKSGETISSIAFDYDVDWQDIATANNLKDPYTIFIGQSLCIPASTTTTTSTSTSTSSSSTSNAPTFELTRDSTRIYVSTTNFRKESSYFVKIRNGGTTDIEWYKLDDLLLTQKSGSVEASYRLPVGWRLVKIITVCFKNMETDSLVCNSVVYKPTGR